MAVKGKFFLSDMINSLDIEIILKINVTKAKRKERVVYHCVFNFHLHFFFL